MNQTNNPKLKRNAQKLRREMTKEERRLWYDFLKQLPITVNRQKVIGPYIVDFYCASAKLVIEAGELRVAAEGPPHPPQCAHWGTFPSRGRHAAPRPVKMHPGLQSYQNQRTIPRKSAPRRLPAAKGVHNMDCSGRKPSRRPLLPLSQEALKNRKSLILLGFSTFRISCPFCQ